MVTMPLNILLEFWTLPPVVMLISPTHF